MNLNNENKEYKPLIPYHLRPPAKRWKSSQQKSKWTDVKLDNELLNNAFMLLLTRIKRLYNGSGTLVYDHDQRSDSTFNPCTMHSFITADLFLEIECEHVHHRCQVLYDFQNCPFEIQVRNWLREYPFSIASAHKRCDGGVAAYFDRILAYQGDKYFHNL